MARFKGIALALTLCAATLYNVTLLALPAMAENEFSPAFCGVAQNCANYIPGFLNGTGCSGGQSCGCFWSGSNQDKVFTICVLTNSNAVCQNTGTGGTTTCTMYYANCGCPTNGNCLAGNNLLNCCANISIPQGTTTLTITNTSCVNQ